VWKILIAAAGAVAGLFYLQYRQALAQRQTAEPALGSVGILPEVTIAVQQLPVIGKYFVNTDGVKAIARAIAFAEGFYVPGSRAARNHNPGDLTQDIGGNDIHPVAFDGPFAVYSTDVQGFADLEQQILFWLTSRSKVANPHDTIASLSSKYTATEQAGWARNVASYLNVSINTKLSELA
jgi:hypothetical protein